MLSQGLNQNSQINNNGKQFEKTKSKLERADFAENTEQGGPRERPDPDIRSWTEKEQLQLLLENTNDYFSLRDDQGRAVLYNSAFVKLVDEAFGVKMKPGIKPHLSLVDQGAREYWDGLYQRVLSGEEFRAFYTHSFGTGESRHFETSFCPIREKGRVVGFTEVNRDITELKQAEDELRESRARHKNLSEKIPDMVYRMSLPDGGYKYVSPASETVTGYTPEEYYSSPRLVGQHLHPDFIEYFREQWSKLLDGHAPPSYEYAIIHKSGELRWLNQRNTLIKDYRGRPVALEGVVTDITDRKKAELELKESRELFRSFMENLPGDAFIRDGQGRYVFANRQFLKHAGLKREEVYGKTNYNLFPRTMAVEFGANDQVIRSHGQTFTFRAKVPNRDNGSRRLIVHKFPVRMPEAENLIGGMAFDITKEFELQKDLRESESRFQEMADLAPVFLVELDTGLAVTYANQMAREVLKRTTVGINDGSKIWPLFRLKRSRQTKRNLS